MLLILNALRDIYKNRNHKTPIIKSKRKEPLACYFDAVNRHAIVIKPKQPLLNWINTIYPNMAEDGSETTVYLVKKRSSAEDTEKWLKKNYGEIFENELNGHHTEEKLLTYKKKV